MRNALLLLFLAACGHQGGAMKSEILNVEQIPSLRQGTTYVPMLDPESPVAKEYIEVYRQYWTASPLEFIKYSDIPRHRVPGSWFFMPGGYTITAQFVSTNQKTGQTTYGSSFENTHIFLELRTCVVEHDDGQDICAEEDDLRVARLELYTDFPTLMAPESLYGAEYDGDGHLRNWGPGLLKNYLQKLMRDLDKGAVLGLFRSIRQPQKLEELATKTLYIPDYTLIEFGAFTGDESGRLDPQELLADYPYRTEVISTADLNAKILADAEPFYYLVYVKSSTDKFIRVIDSRTGDVVYGTYESVSYNMDADDFEELSEAVDVAKRSPKPAEEKKPEPVAPTPPAPQPTTVDG